MANKKITWDVIYKDFKQRHPILSKQVLRWWPVDYLTIQIKLKDGSELVYYYWDHMGKFINK